MRPSLRPAVCGVGGVVGSGGEGCDSETRDPLSQRQLKQEQVLGKILTQTFPCYLKYCPEEKCILYVTEKL